jgi:hypothetical protein
MLLSPYLLIINDRLNWILSNRLEQNYPNPFNQSTSIKFSIPKKSTVKLTIYNQLGELIQTLINEEKSTSTYEITFNGQDLASGIYFYQIKANNFVSTKKLVLLK